MQAVSSPGPPRPRTAANAAARARTRARRRPRGGTPRRRDRNAGARRVSSGDTVALDSNHRRGRAMTDPATERTLPRMVAAAVARFGPRSPRSRTATSGSRSRSSARPGCALRARSSPRASSTAIAWRSGRRTSRSGSSPRSARRASARCWFRSARATRAPRPPTCCARAARACCARSRASSTPTTSACSRATTCPRSSAIVMLRGEAPGAQRWERLPRGGRARARGGGARARRRGRARRCRRHALHLGHDRQAEGRARAHGQNLRVFEVWSGWVGVREGDRYLVVAPFFHSFGYKAGWLAALMRGATILPHAVFDAEAVLQRIERERITVLPGPPTIYQSLLALPNWRQLRPLVAAPRGDRRRGDPGRARSTACATSSASRPCSRRTGSPSRAASSACATRATTPRRSPPPRAARSRASRCAASIADGKEVPRGQPGEIWVRGYNVMRGYFDADEQTREAIDAEGWLHTGDVGVMDERGYLRITDRIKDMFIVGGFNCYPAEIENLMFAHEAIAQVAVIGIPDERMGEVGMAFVVPAPGHAPTPEVAAGWCREQMANYKVPRRIEIVRALPRERGRQGRQAGAAPARGRGAARDRGRRRSGSWSRRARRRRPMRCSRSTSATARSRSRAIATRRCARRPGSTRAAIAADTPVSWMLPTTLEALVLAAALARLGAVQNPILPIYRERETRFITRQTRARLLCVPPVFRNFDYPALARTLRAERADLDVLIVDGSLPEGDPGRPARPAARARRGAPARALDPLLLGHDLRPEGRPAHRREPDRELRRARARARAGARRPTRVRVPAHARGRDRLADRGPARRLRAHRRGDLRPEDA